MKEHHTERYAKPKPVLYKACKCDTNRTAGGRCVKCGVKWKQTKPLTQKSRFTSSKYEPAKTR